MEDRYLNFYCYVMECIDDKDLPPDNEVCMCEDLCKTCVIPQEFGEIGVNTLSCKSYKK